MVSVSVALAMVLGYAVTVGAPDGPDFGCPSPRQVTAAMSARAPGTVTPGEDLLTPGLLRLNVSGGGPAGALQIDLIDETGVQRLRRSLPSENQNGGTADCGALAETVALIVDRFLHDVGSPPPATGGPPAGAQPGVDAAASGDPTRSTTLRFGALVAGGWRAGTEGSGAEANLGVHLLKRSGALPAGLTLTGGIAPAQTARWPTGGVILRRFPVRLALFLSLPAGFGRLEPGLGGGVDLLLVDSSGVGGPRDRLFFSPAGEAGVGYRIPVGARLFLRPVVTGGVAVPYGFLVPAGGATGGGAAVLATPRFYVRTGIELGTYFR